MKKRAPPDIPLEDLRKRFHLPLAEVAKEFGVCMTFIKKVCRSHGIKRWPYRKIKSLQNKAQKLSALRACHAAKAVEKHVDAIRELTGGAADEGMDGLGDVGEEELDEEEDDDEVFGMLPMPSAAQAGGSDLLDLQLQPLHTAPMPQEAPAAARKAGRGRGMVPQNPALLRTAAAAGIADPHHYAYSGHDALGSRASVPMSHHESLREALLGAADVPGAQGAALAPRIKSEEPQEEQRFIASQVDNDDLIAQSDLAFESLWADGVWSMPSPVSQMLKDDSKDNLRLSLDSGGSGGSRSQSFRGMPRIGSNGRLQDMELGSGGIPRNGSFDRSHSALHSNMVRDRSYDRIDRLNATSRDRSYEMLSRATDRRRPPPRTMSGENLDRHAQVKNEEEAHGLVEAKGPHGGMRRNLSCGSLRDYVEARGNGSSMPRSSSQNSLSDLLGRGITRDDSRSSLPRVDSQECLMGDTVFVF